jgi:hypothetical protein
MPKHSMHDIVNANDDKPFNIVMVMGLVRYLSIFITIVSPSIAVPSSINLVASLMKISVSVSINDI